MSGRAVFRTATAASLAAVLLATGAAEACTVTVTPLVFGRYDVFDRAPLDSTGNVSYTCGPMTPRVRIRFAREAGASPRSRHLASGQDRLAYQLFMDPGKTRIWGDETEGTDALYVQTPPPGKPVMVPVYARIPPGQNVRAGTYSDSVLVIVDY